MTEPTRPSLPAVALRTVTESEYRRLEARAAAAADLERRLAALEQGGSGGDLLAELLPVLDAFALALRSAALAHSPVAIVEGVELVEREMRRVLERHGLERIPVGPGDPFDLSLHETLEGLDALVAEVPLVAEELRPGYRRGGRVLRRALVRLAAERSDG